MDNAWTKKEAPKPFRAEEYEDLGEIESARLQQRDGNWAYARALGIKLVADSLQELAISAFVADSLDEAELLKAMSKRYAALSECHLTAWRERPREYEKVLGEELT